MSLVEILTLVLLAGILVLLVLIFNNITAARRALEEGERARPGAGSGARSGAGYEGGTGSPAGYGAPGTAGTSEGYGPAAGAGGGGGYGAGAGGGYGAGTPGYETQPGGGYGAASEPPRTAEQPAYTGAEQPSDYASWSESAVGTGQGGTGAAVEEFPEETPFERDGRWWFKRGDELLVYDEQAGQWIAPPPGTTPGGSAQPAGGGTYGGYEPAVQGGETAGAAAAGEPGGWRCPSCGAINGASATTCRMCFSARP